MNFKIILAISAIFLLSLSFSFASDLDDNLTTQGTIYVSPDGSGDGLTNLTPTNFNTALNIASSGDTIELADGNYTNIKATIYNINLKGSKNTTFDAQNSGGFFTTHGSVTLENINFINAYTGEKQGSPSGNKTGYDGEGAIVNTGYLTVKNCYFASNQGIGTEGGSIHNSGTCYVYDSLFYGNGGKKGGAMYSDEGSSLYVYNTIISRCVSREGSAVHAKEAYVEIHNCTVANSSAKNGLFYIKKSQMKFYDSYFYNSKAVDSAGVINIDKESSVEIDNCRFEKISSTGTKLWFHDEYGSGDGGVIVVEKEVKDVSIKNSQFINCSAKGYGGVLYLDTSASITIDNCTFKSNNASYGDNIYSTRYASRLTIINSVFDVKTTIETSDIDFGDDEIINITYDDGTNNLLNPSYSVSVGNQTYSLTSKTLTISNLNIGNYTAVLQAGDYNSNVYVLSQNSSLFVVGGVNLIATVSFSFNSEGVLNVKVIDEYERAVKNTLVTLTINGSKYESNTNANGIASYAINLDLGVYDVEVDVYGKVVSEDSPKTLTVLNKTEIPLSDEVIVTFSYNDNGSVNVEVKDIYNRVIQNNTLTLTVNNIAYNLKTDDDGIAVLNPINTNAGEYPVEIEVSGKNISASSQKTLKVMPSNNVSSIIAEDLTRAFNSSYDFKAILLDKNANPLKNMEINFVINGNDYLTTTDEYGYAYLKNTLSEGVYNVCVENPATNEKLTKTLTIVSRISGNSNINVDYSFTKTYKISVYADNGQLVGSGESVKITLNKKTITLKTDANGQISYKISSLLPKTYTIKAEYKGFSVVNKVVVKQILKASNKNFKKSATKKYTATLKTSLGKAIKNKKITFKINGKTYSAKTNKKGIASVNLKSLTKTGKYKITITYLKTSIKKTITVKK